MGERLGERRPLSPPQLTAPWGGRRLVLPRAATAVKPTAWVYAALFVAFFALAGTFVAFASQLAQAGISRAVYFLVLVPAGLGSAAFLDRMLHATSALWVAKLWFGKFRLGGSVAVFGMVVGAGLYVMSTPPPLQLVVRVQVPGADAGAAARGNVTLFAGKLSWAKDLSAAGEAVFESLPEHLRSESVRLVAEVPGYDPSESRLPSIPASEVVEFSLRRSPPPPPPISVMTGTVLASDHQPLAGAFVDFEHGLAQVKTDAFGHFRAELTRTPGSSVLVVVLFNGRIGHEGYYTVPNELTLRFGR